MRYCGHLFLVLEGTLILSLIVNIGYAAVLPTPESTTLTRPHNGFRDAFVKTNFSCEGRPSGYYADVDTGCELYHMCDELGRKFSYACPNTTLFQQRMLVCDHWFMVNCSKAEDDYSANLLIGQKDKPFVGAEENVLRTPRPDLTDRPYSADYSGESFRRHYKHHIKSGDNPSTTVEPEYAPIHWGTGSKKQDKDQPLITDAATQDTAESQNSINGLRVFQMPVGFTKPEIVKSLDVSNSVKIPLSIAELPNQHSEFSKVSERIDIPVTDILVNVPKSANVSPSSHAKAFKSKEHNDVARQFTTKDTDAIAENVTPLPQTASTTTTEALITPIALIDTSDSPRPTNGIVEPIDGLQPPHLDYKTYDDSTTEGPPIYYQWKWAVPAFVLEPPKLNEPDVKSPSATSSDDRPTGNSDQSSSVKFNPNFFKKTTQQPLHNYIELRKTLSIPTFDFPLETDGRSDLTKPEALNSYQLKIPSSAKDASWYGENGACPECHPAFLQPGTCEPCVKQ